MQRRSIVLSDMHTGIDIDGADVRSACHTLIIVVPGGRSTLDIAFKEIGLLASGNSLGSALGGGK